MSRATHTVVREFYERETFALETQNKRLRKQIKRQQDVIAQLQSHNIRMDRKAAGLSEEPRKSKPVDTEPVPPEVHDYLEAFESPEMRANLEDDIAMARSQGTPWTEIVKLLELDMDADVQPEAD